MNYKLLGTSGLRVSELSLGTMTFGTEWDIGADEADSREVFDLYAEAGGNFIDTANFYTNGTSERLLGQFLRTQRDRFVLATKFTLNMHPGDPNAGGNHRKNIRQSVEDSLRRLETEYIDLLWLHMWDFTTRPEEVMRTLDDLVASGKVHYIGISDTPAWIIAESNMLAELRGWEPFSAIQIEYSLVQRTVERELLPMADAKGLSVLAWSPLGGGVLTGKYKNVAGAEEVSGRLKPDSKKLSEHNLGIARAVGEVADAIGAKSTQVALAWLRRNPDVIPILGARNAAQLKENLGCLEVDLSDDHLAKLDEASAVDMGFPHNFLASDNVKAYVFGGTEDKLDF